MPKQRIFEKPITDMDDWTLESIHFDWASAVAELRLKSPRGQETITARGVHDIKTPHLSPWGPSVSVNTADGPKLVDGGLQYLNIEMQSGDVIEVSAPSFTLSLMTPL